MENKVNREKQYLTKFNYEQQKEIEKQSLIEQKNIETFDEITQKIYSYIKDNKVINSEIMSDELKINIQDLNSSLTMLELSGLIINKSCSNYAIKEKFDV